MNKPVSIVALIAAYNEEDVIAECLGDLLRQGIGVYLLDDGSTDGTVSEAERFRGQGLLEVEQLRPPSEPRAGRFSLRRIIARKQELARTLEADWFLNHDADEFREGPWPGRSLAESIGAVDGLGFNAIDFEVFNFWPTHDRIERGQSVREAFVHYERGQSFNAVQVRCWKKHPEVELVSTAGHEARFAGRQVFPLRFVLRHYPLRGQRHAERKVLIERKPRFDEGERAEGWHVQYDEVRPGASFLRREEELTAWDGEQVRLVLALENRGAQARAEDLAKARARLASVEQSLARVQRQLASAAAERDRLAGEARALGTDLGRARAESGRLRGERDALTGERDRLRAEGDRLRAEGDRLRADRDALRAALDQARADLDAVYTSKSWKWTGPARTVLKRWRGY